MPLKAPHSPPGHKPLQDIAQRLRSAYIGVCGLLQCVQPAHIPAQNSSNNTKSILSRLTAIYSGFIFALIIYRLAHLNAPSVVLRRLARIAVLFAVWRRVFGFSVDARQRVPASERPAACAAWPHSRKPLSESAFCAFWRLEKKFSFCAVLYFNPRLTRFATAHIDPLHQPQYRFLQQHTCSPVRFKPARPFQTP